MILRVALIGLASAALAAAPASAVGKSKNVSWGKPDVSFADYRADALQCADRAYGVEVRMEPYGPSANGLLGGVMPAAIWLKLTPGSIPVYSTDYVDGYRHAALLDTIEQLQAEVDTCLAGKGYHRFRLTSAQMDELRRLRMGTPERARFLYGLGSNERVLAAQRI
jgi:hypothetical protein